MKKHFNKPFFVFFSLILSSATFADCGNLQSLLPNNYTTIEYCDFNYGLAPIQFKQKYGFANKQGKIIVTPQYDEVESFADGLAKVKVNGKTAFIDTKGKYRLNFNDLAKYKYVLNFNEGLASVCDFNDKCGFINKNGKIKIPLMYENTIVFNEGLADVKKNGKWGYINKKNQIVIPFIYDNTEIFLNGIAEVKKDGESFSINKKGKRID